MIRLSKVMLRRCQSVNWIDLTLTVKFGTFHIMVCTTLIKALRVLFDCGAKYQGTSLNNQLLQGPNLTSSLIGVLLRFRKELVAFMTDVTAMFYQVKVAEEGRDFLRFLWWPGGDVTQVAAVFRMTVHIFGAVSSPS